MKRLRTILVIIGSLLMLGGCQMFAGGVGKLDVPTGSLDGDGDAIMKETTESVLIAEQFTQAMQYAKEPENVCAGSFTPDQVAALKEGGQQMYMFSMMTCQIALGLSQAVRSARDLPTTAAGEIAHAAQKAVATTEQTDAAETASNTNMTARIASGGFLYLGFKSMAENQGSETTYGDTTINASNSGAEGGAGGEGAGGAGQIGDRNMSISVNGSTSNFQPGDSNTQATAEKATSVDNPIVSGGPNNSIVNDADANGNDGRLF